MISFEDFKKVEMTVGEILSAEKIPDTDKLLKLSVGFGLITIPVVTDITSSEEIVEVIEIQEKREIRQIVSGISMYFPDCSVLVGKKCMFVTNLEPRMIRGFESNGMILAVSTEDGKFSLLEPSAEIPAGTQAK
ncbi:MAG: hypothetical protein WAV23_04365 [Minisyncoccia bacterium]